MWIQSLQARGLRCFDEINVKFSPGTNIIYGDNGAGKTSILEGISVLSCGKSFRASKLSHIINDHFNELTLFGEVQTSEQLISLGMQNINGMTNLRVNREKVSKWSEVALNLPVLEIHPESYRLITDGPIERRKYLNWGMFHVEPSFGQTWSEYNRALKQRNICLKNNHVKQARNWHKSLSEHGNLIASAASKYAENIIPIIDEICNQFDLPNNIAIKYFSGWDQAYDLYELLELELQEAELSKTTMYGPHRADLKISWNNLPFAKTSSRGQQKVLAIALKIAQANYLKQVTGKPCVYLIDELPAELDSTRRAMALDLLGQLNAQIIITAVSKDSVNYANNETKWFHVEQCVVSAVV